MRKGIITILSVVTYICSFATTVSDIKDANFIVTDNGSSYYAKIRLGFSDRLTAITNIREKEITHLGNVKTYRIKEQKFHVEFMLIPGTQSIESVFLERIYSYSSYSLFKRVKSTQEPLCFNDLYIYKDDIRVYQLTNDNYKEIISSFFPKFRLILKYM